MTSVYYWRQNVKQCYKFKIIFSTHYIINYAATSASKNSKIDNMFIFVQPKTWYF